MRWKQLFTEERKLHLRKVIFSSDTAAGRKFDLWLLLIILVSCGLVMLESVKAVEERCGLLLRVLEWVITLVFTAEYALRVWSAPNRLRYMFSFYGIVDLLAVAPTYLSIFFPWAHSFALVRAVRFTRVFRILGLVNYMHEARLLLMALLASRHRIIVFMLAVLALVTVFGAVMFMIEPREAGFTSIPRSIYWAIVTLTTVGYGDIAPSTTLGQVFASMIMILGYAIIAIPTGIVSVEMSRQVRNGADRKCPSCGTVGHVPEARYCHHCSSALVSES